MPLCMGNCKQFTQQTEGMALCRTHTMVDQLTDCSALVGLHQVFFPLYFHKEREETVNGLAGQMRDQDPL